MCAALLNLFCSWFLLCKIQVYSEPPLGCHCNPRAMLFLLFLITLMFDSLLASHTHTQTHTVLLQGIEPPTLQLMDDPICLVSHSCLHKSDSLICWPLRGSISAVGVKGVIEEHHRGENEEGETRCSLTFPADLAYWAQRLNHRASLD